MAKAPDLGMDSSAEVLVGRVRVAAGPYTTFVVDSDGNLGVRCEATCSAGVDGKDRRHFHRRKTKHMDRSCCC